MTGFGRAMDAWLRGMAHREAEERERRRREAMPKGRLLAEYDHSYYTRGAYCSGGWGKFVVTKEGEVWEQTGYNRYCNPDESYDDPSCDVHEPKRLTSKDLPRLVKEYPLNKDKELELRRLLGKKKKKKGKKKKSRK